MFSQAKPHENTQEISSNEMLEMSNFDGKIKGKLFRRFLIVYFRALFLKAARWLPFAPSETLTMYSLTLVNFIFPLIFTILLLRGLLIIYKEHLVPLRVLLCSFCERGFAIKGKNNTRFAKTSFEGRNFVLPMTQKGKNFMNVQVPLLEKMGQFCLKLE